jgi:hypothetical protein
LNFLVNSFIAGDWTPCSVTCGEGVMIRKYVCKIFLEFSKIIATIDDSKCHGYKPPDDYQRCFKEPCPYSHGGFDSERHNHVEFSYIAADFGPCSATCGEGVRVRKYECKKFVNSKGVATVDDNKCHELKPADDYQRCYMDACSSAYSGYDDRSANRDRLNNDQIKVQAAVPGKSYSWRDEGYTSCSASCLGGVEELIINCVRDDTGKVVSPYLCSPETKPENRIRTCNDIPCPPRWNYSDYSPCTKSCGIGIKTREINCIHEVTRGGENTMIVPNSMW